MDERDQEVQALVLRLVALEDFDQRMHVLAEVIQAVSADHMVELLDAAFAAVSRGETGPRTVIDVFHAAIDGGVVALELRDAIYAAAAECGSTQVQRIMLAPPPREREPKRHSAGSANIGQTLGMRKWMARRVSSDQLDRMLKDIDVTVVANLLKNPHVTEQDVVRIVAQRPNFPAVIAAVGRSARWNRNYPVRRAIVFNPYSPVDLALRQVTFLTRQDLFAVAGDPKLHEQVRLAASELAQRRPPDKTEGESAGDDGLDPEVARYADALGEKLQDALEEAAQISAETADDDDKDDAD